MEPSVLLLKLLDCNPPALAERSGHGNDCHECLLWVGRLDDMKEDLGGRGQLVLIPLMNLDVRNPGALELTRPFAMAYQDLDDTHGYGRQEQNGKNGLGAGQ